MKLYDDTPHVHGNDAIGRLISTQAQDVQDFEEDLDQLECHTAAYGSLALVQTQVASESFSFIDKGNHILYNEYIKAITANLNLTHVPVVSQEAIDTLPVVALNHHLSLEGFIGDIWAKIKALFVKVYDTVKKFFTSIFTRIGRLKAKLTNLEKVLRTTDKQLQKAGNDKVPSSLSSKYPISGNLTLQTINEVFANTTAIGDLLVSMNKQATELAGKEILDKNFVTGIKNLRSQSQSAKDEIDANNADKEKGVKAALGLSKKNKEIDKSNDSLKKIADDAEKSAEDEEGKASDIASKNAGLDIDDKGFEAAKKEFGAFLKTIEDGFNKVKGKPLISGKHITQVTVKPDEGVEFETEESKETPSQIQYGDVMELRKLVETTISVVDNLEGAAKSYGDINETIMKNLDVVDKLVKDIDAIGDQKLGKYKTVLTAKIRERLNLMKSFFRDYNKVNKNLTEMVVEAAEGNVAYTVESLKYFG